jgi:hypothetical protein
VDDNCQSRTSPTLIHRRQPLIQQLVLLKFLSPAFFCHAISPSYSHYPLFLHAPCCPRSHTIPNQPPPWSQSCSVFKPVPQDQSFASSFLHLSSLFATTADQSPTLQHFPLRLSSLHPCNLHSLVLTWCYLSQVKAHLTPFQYLFTNSCSFYSTFSAHRQRHPCRHINHIVHFSRLTILETVIID